MSLYYGHSYWMNESNAHYDEWVSQIFSGFYQINAKKEEVFVFGPQNTRLEEPTLEDPKDY